MLGRGYGNDSGLVRLRQIKSQNKQSSSNTFVPKYWKKTKITQAKGSIQS
jgi:hypothetical protein